MSSDRYLKRLASKEWSQIRSRLAGTRLLETTNLVESLAENPVLREHAIPFDWKPERRFSESAFKDAVIAEGLYFGHRAFRVGACAFEIADGGLPTWAIVNAYHSSYFAMRAILCLFGITYLELQDGDARVHVLLDTLPGEQKGKRTGRHGSIIDDEIQLLDVPRFEHRHWWELFASQLNRLRGFPGDASGIRTLLGIDSKDVPFHRNQILYWNKWFFDDLYQAQSSPDFCWRQMREGNALEEQFIELGCEDRTAALAVILLWFYRVLLDDIPATTFRNEGKRVLEMLSSTTHIHERVQAHSIFV